MYYAELRRAMVHLKEDGMPRLENLKAAISPTGGTHLTPKRNRTMSIEKTHVSVILPPKAQPLCYPPTYPSAASFKSSCKL